MFKNRVNLLLSMTCVSTLMLSASYAQTSETVEAVAPIAPAMSESIVATVNDRVITTYDVRQRIRLMMLSANGQISPESLPQLEEQAIQDLVDEKLKLLEALEWELEADKSEIEAEVQHMAEESGLTVDQLSEVLTSRGISLESFKERIEASVLWPRLVQSRFGRKVRIDEDEIESTLERMRDDASNVQFLVSEICLAVDDPSQAQAYYQGGLQLIEQLRRGVPFAVIAQQFSSCTSAAAGGDLGWIRAGELAPELDNALKALPNGAVTNPIPSEGAFMIMALRDKREAVIAGEPSFTLAYAGAPLSMGASAARIALEKLPAADACGGRAQRQDLGAGVGIALVENITVGAIDPRFQSAIEDLERGEMSPILEVDGALHAVVVCDKDEGYGLPSRNALEDRLYSTQLALIAQRYLRDVERDSTVDIRRSKRSSAAAATEQ